MIKIYKYAFKVKFKKDIYFCERTFFNKIII